MTKGEYRVGITFNPSQDDTVARIKRAAADLIDLIDSVQTSEIGPDYGPPESREASVQAIEKLRCKVLAQNAVEEAAMWAVKAATKPQPQNS